MVPDTFSVGLGRLVHDVLARIDFADPSQVALWCEQLAPRHVLVDSDRACRLATEMVERLVTSPRGRRLAAAAELHCEIDFLLAWPPGQPGGADRRFYGYLDCLYRDADGRWHLADYKTNHVAAADVPRLAQHHQMQLYVYAIAAERVLGQPPDELVLCFLQPGVEHVLPWNDSVRRRAVEMVSAAMGDRPTTTKRQDDIARNIRGANS